MNLRHPRHLRLKNHSSSAGKRPFPDTEISQGSGEDTAKHRRRYQRTRAEISADFHAKERKNTIEKCASPENISYICNE